MNRPLSASSPRHSLKTDIGYEPDGCWESGAQKVWVEVKSGTHSFRNVRASLLGLAYLLAGEPDSRALLVLTDSRITEDRLHAEVQLAARTLRPDVMRRLSLVLRKEEFYLGLPSRLGTGFHSWLDELVEKESQRGTKPRLSYDEVLKVMIHQKLLGAEPVTTDWITQAVGCSYPTAARALERLGHVRVRRTDRKAVLRGFPYEEWARLVTMSDETRATKRYVDRSGQPRSAQSLLRRLAQVGRSDLAVGGIEGARHYYPQIDLIGLPRLDLSLHSPGGYVDWSFIERLDPALEETKERDAPVVLAVHLVRRQLSFFESDKKNIQWADPVECLLDLHEARLEAQAKALLNFFITRNSGKA